MVVSPFNSPMESGLRALTILVEAFPMCLDLEYLVFFDYLTVHSGDIEGGPESLHAPLPMRSGELTVRRKLIERGLLLMMSRNLASRVASNEGFAYVATDSASAFLEMLSSQYILNLRDRSKWVVSTFGSFTPDQIYAQERQLFRSWTNQFQPLSGSTSRFS
ncbi:ABC-three component system middle component 2 [Leptolyngbya iicbica]|jgi:hypothetical protein|uniref:ABC-three component system middle component 2 n=1 Tax=Leptolyngbya iicbica TaxID=3161580 RepID=UPI0009079ED9|nr:ABC-three component system middle component 2 [Leptolyngbya sp. LK]